MTKYPGQSRYLLLWFLPALAAVVHLTANAFGGYGIFRDELYYIACANHPDLGYVDHPPLSIWILAAWKFLFGDSLFSIRFLPALCSGFTVFVGGRIVYRLGGQTYALVLAALALIFAPISLAFFSIFSMNAFDLLLWSLAFLIALRLFQRPSPELWYTLGMIVGLGALNKISMLWLGAGLGAGILLTPHRRVLQSVTPWIAGFLAAMIFLPFVIWNLTHEFAHLEFMRNASTGKYLSQNPFTFLTGILFIVNPVAAPVCLAGFWLLLARRECRVIGLAVCVVLCILLINVHSKPEYFAASLTALFPAGAVQLERLFTHHRLRWIRIPYIVLIMGSGLFLMPLTRDVLPVESYIRYQSLLGMTPISNEGLRLNSLPQFYADRFGWNHMAEATAGVYAALPESDKERCRIYGRNYGEAGAIDYFGRVSDLPPAISRHNSYWFWSRQHLRQDMILIAIGIPKEQLAEEFEEVHEAAIIQSEHVMPYEYNLPVCICRKPRRSIHEFWETLKLFI